MLRSGTNEQEWHGVGVVLSNELKEDLTSVSRNSDPVMTIELGLEEMLINIMCASAPSRKERQRKLMGFQKMCGCVWEKKGLTCYQYDAKCIRAG